MTPEEKQAIINKALELGFEKVLRMRMYVNEKQDILVYSMKPCFYFARFENGYKDSIEVTSLKQLETLFNAIVS